MDDLNLLRQYADHHCESAFRQLVEIHAHWVYSASLRQVRDAHLAEDVTQAVFIALAQRAGTIRSHAALASWLFKATRFASVDVIRRDRRRKHHETKAVTMAIHSANPDPRDSWRELAPLLETLVTQLARRDRHAILLRFYEQKSLRDVGLALGVSEEAAKKRVSRAIQALRALCSNGGLATAAALSATLLDANVTAAAPPGLTASAATAATVAGGAGNSAALALADHITRKIFMFKTKLIAALGAGAGAMIGIGVIASQSPRQNNPSPPTPAPLVSKGSPTTAPSTQAVPPATQEQAIRLAIAARLASLQSISIDYDVEETFTPLLPPAASIAAAPPTPVAQPPIRGMTFTLKTGTERSIRSLSFLNGAARYETKFSDEAQADLRRQNVVPLVSMTETFSAGSYQQLLYRGDGPNGWVGQFKAPPKWDALGVALGLRDGWQDPNNLPNPDGNWMTAQLLAQMDLGQDDTGRVRLARTNNAGQTLEWFLDPAQRYAVVAYHRRDAQPPHAILDDVTATDFKPVEGIPFPHTLVARTLRPDGYELQRWRATVTRYGLKSAGNIAARYQITWPAGMAIIDREAHIELRATADGRLPALPPAPLTAADPRNATAPDASTPRGAAKLFFQAVIRAEATTAKGLLHADDDTKAQVDAILEEADALHALEHATVTRFGESARGKVAWNPFANFLQRLDALDLRIDGDTATLSAPGRPDPAMRFHRATDGWQIQQLPGSGPELIRSALVMADIANHLTAEVSEGKVTTAADAARQLMQRYTARVRELGHVGK